MREASPRRSLFREFYSAMSEQEDLRKFVKMVTGETGLPTPPAGVQRRYTPNAIIAIIKDICDKNNLVAETQVAQDDRWKIGLWINTGEKTVGWFKKRKKKIFERCGYIDILFRTQKAGWEFRITCKRSSMIDVFDEIAAGLKKEFSSPNNSFQVIL